MTTQKMPWFRMYTDFLNDPKMIALAFEDQRHFIGILALKSDGALEAEVDDSLMDRIVAQRLWIDHGVIREVKKRLVASGLIDANWQPLAWDKRQFKSDKDGTAAERQRRFREAKQANALRNAPVTRLETDTEAETDKKAAPVGADVCPGFAEFWKTWPASERKQAKGKCLEAWKKAKAEAVSADVVSHVKQLKASEGWTKQNAQFIPAPLVYLSQRRWEGAESQDGADSSVGHFV